MSSTKQTSAEVDWLRYKETIRRLYLSDEVPLKELLVHLKDLGLSVTKAQLEYKIKLWNFRKNIPKACWTSVDYKITKRKHQGKDSQVIYGGKRLKPSTVQKETDRHRDRSIFAQLSAAAPLASQDDTDVLVCTPQPLSMEFEWPESLPWLRFRSTHLFSWINHHSTISRESGNMEPVIALWSQQNITNALPTSNGASYDTLLNACSLAPIMGRSMPECYLGEHLQRAHVMLTGAEEEKLHEIWEMVLFTVSNNLSSHEDTSEWDATMSLVRYSGLLDSKVNLWSLGDKTLQATLEKLFGNAMEWALADTHCVSSRIRKKESISILEGLLASGCSPDTLVFSFFDDTLATPLQSACTVGDIEIVQLLLEAGANVNFPVIEPNQVDTSPPHLALENVVRRTPTRTKILNLLTSYGPSTYKDELLCMAIRCQDEQWALELVEKGADLTAVQHPRGTMIYQETVLSVAASTSAQAVVFVLGLLRARMSSRSLLQFATSDTMIAAAKRGSNNTVRLIHDINSNAIHPNHYGITPLQVASIYGHLSTCRFILDLQGSYAPSWTYPSPLYLASYSGSEELVQLFLDRGADVNAKIASCTDGEMVKFLQHFPINHSCTKESTPLQACVRKIWSGHKSVGCAVKLLRAGAHFEPGEIMIEAVRNLQPSLLLTALAATSDAGLALPDLNLLHMALTTLSRSQDKPPFSMRRQEIVKLLLEAGFRPTGGAVILAIEVKNWDLVETLTSNGGSLTDVDSQGKTALEAALLSMNPSIVEKVLKAQPNLYEPGALCAAVAAANLPMTRRLLALRPMDSAIDALETTAVGLAAFQGDISLMRGMLASLPRLEFALLPLREFSMHNNKGFWRDADCRKASPLALAAAGSRIEAFEELLNRGYGPDSLTWKRAAEDTNSAILEMLLTRSQQEGQVSPYPPDFYTWPLMHSIDRKDRHLVKRLLQAGAIVSDLDWSSQWERSPLQLAIERGDLIIIDYLLKAGADVNAPAASNDGRTALQLAAMQAQLGLAKQLLELGAKIDAPGAPTGGKTALERAAESGRLDMVELLLGHGASTTGPGRRQYVRAVRLAKREGHHVAAGLLREFRDWTEEDDCMYIEKDLLDEGGRRDDDNDE